MDASIEATYEQLKQRLVQRIDLFMQSSRAHLENSEAIRRLSAIIFGMDSAPYYVIEHYVIWMEQMTNPAMEQMLMAYIPTNPEPFYIDPPPPLPTPTLIYRPIPVLRPVIYMPNIYSHYHYHYERPPFCGSVYQNQLHLYAKDLQTRVEEDKAMSTSEDAPTQSIDITADSAEEEEAVDVDKVDDCDMVKVD